MMREPRVVFMGSPAFAVPALEALVGAYRVVGVVTQPDRPAGRGSRLRPPAVKVAAERLGLPVFQPEQVAAPDAMEHLRAWAPDVIVVAAFGQILLPDLLALPPYGCLNLHASLLPRWRGAAPIAAAILAGDAVTGVTLMQMDEGVDTGPLLARREEPIRPDDTTGRLTERLARVGAELLVDVLPRYLRGEIRPVPQPEEGVTYCRPLKKEDGHLDWARPAAELERRVRATNPWPGAFTFWKGQMLKVWRAAAHPDRVGDAPPGTVIPMGDGAAVVTGQGLLELLEIQMAGKNSLPIEAFLRGRRNFIGAVLG